MKMRLGLGLGLGGTHGGGGGSVTITPGVKLWGDSMSADASAGGGAGSYQATPAALTRALTKANVPLTVTDNSFSGETGAQIVARWNARSAYVSDNWFTIGRNSDGTSGLGLGTAGALASLKLQIQGIIDTAKPGENLYFESIHNYNDSTGVGAFQGERVGGANAATYNNILDLNSWISGKDNGTSVYYVDTREASIAAYNQNNSTDLADITNNQPPRSLTSDGLHRNAQGTEIKVRQMFAAIYARYLVTNPRTNIVVNGSFGANVTGWTAGGSTTLTWNGGRMDISGAGTFKSAGQNVLASGAAGKVVLVMWDYPTYNGNIAFKPRPFVGGGSNYGIPSGFGSEFSSPSLPYNPGDSRAGKNFLTFVNCTDAQLALLWEAQSDASALWSLDNIVAHVIP